MFLFSTVLSLYFNQIQNPPTEPRLYANLQDVYPQDYFTYEKVNLNLSSQDNYEIISKCGSGKYSEAFVGIDIRTNQKIVIKIIKPVKYLKVYREIKIMQALIGAPFTLQLLDITSVKDSIYPALIVDYAGEPLNTVLQDMSLHDFKLYMGQFLLSLHYLHIHGIIHRDCKPANCCIQNNRLCLLDFNLASFYQKTGLHYRVATRSWKAPELLLCYEYYGYEIDIWAVGVMIFSYLQQRQLFISQNNDQCLERIVELLGSDGVIQLAKQIKKPLDDNKLRRLSGYKRQNFKYLIKNYDLKTDQILQKTLCYNPDDRASAAELVKFTWFDEVREELVKSYIQEYQQIKDVIEGRRQLNQTVVPQYTYKEKIQYPIPISPNEILGRDSGVSDQEWQANWYAFQQICNKLGTK